MSAPNRIFAVARNTVRESLRNRILYALVGATALVMMASSLLGFVTPDADAKAHVVIHFSLFALTFFGIIIAIFLGTNLIYQEIEQRTIYTLLARPLSRFEFVAGKYLGLVMVMGLCLAMTGTLLAGWVALNGGSVGLPFLQSLYMTLLEFMVVTGIALFFSVTAHPIEGAVFALVVAIAGRSTGALLDLGELLLKQPGAGFGSRVGVRVLEVLYYLLPNFQNFDLRSEAALAITAPAEMLLASTAYALVYATILLLLSAWSFERRSL